MWLESQPCGLSWMRGTRGWKRALARFRHQGSCFVLSSLVPLSVGSVVCGHGFYHHQSVDNSKMTCGLCSSSRAEVSEYPFVLFSSLLINVPLLTFCIKFLSSLSCNSFCVSPPTSRQPQKLGTPTPIPFSRLSCWGSPRMLITNSCGQVSILILPRINIR